MSTKHTYIHNKVIKAFEKYSYYDSHASSCTRSKKIHKIIHKKGIHDIFFVIITFFLLFFTPYYTCPCRHLANVWPLMNNHNTPGTACLFHQPTSHPVITIPVIQLIGLLTYIDLRNSNIFFPFFYWLNNFLIL